jgi:hypothetical protein
MEKDKENLVIENPGGEKELFVYFLITDVYGTNSTFAMEYKKILESPKEKMEVK